MFLDRETDVFQGGPLQPDVFRRVMRESLHDLIERTKRAERED